MIALLSVKLGAQYSELPLIKSYQRIDYRAQKQNWDIDQLSNGVLCFANSGGLLTFDGCRWNLYRLPNNQALRTIEVKEDTIFAGGYGEFGYWSQHPQNHKLLYQSITAKDTSFDSDREEVWHTLQYAGDVYCQSFGKIFKKAAEGLKLIQPPNTIRFLFAISDALILQVNEMGIYELRNDSLMQIPIHYDWSAMRINGIVSQNNQWIFATEADGLFSVDLQRVRPFHTAIDAALVKEQVNKIVALSNGYLAIGTIANGLYIIGQDGQLIYHLNKERGLLNNTVLSLFEDRQHNLWVGLDDGICMVQLQHPLRFWRDFEGKLGAPYAAAIMDDKLYVGSNQGLYTRAWKTIPSADFELMPGTQGQIWDLLVADKKLFCGHNQGLWQIKEHAIQALTPSSGVYDLVVEQVDPLVLVAGTYNGITVLHEDTLSGEMDFVRTSFERGARWLRKDRWERYWVASPFKGLHRINFSDRMSKIDFVKQYEQGDGLPTDFQLYIEQFNGTSVIFSNGKTFRYDQQCDCFVEDISWLGTPEQGFRKMVRGIEGDLFVIYDDFVELFQGDKLSGRLEISLSEGSRGVIPLDQNYYFFCLDEGYALLDRREKLPEKADNLPLISGVEGFDKTGRLVYTADYPETNVLTLPSRSARVRISYSSSTYGGNAQFRCQLRGFDEEWSTWETSYNKEYTNLAGGDYVFHLQSNLTSEENRLLLSVSPKWHETTPNQVECPVLYHPYWVGCLSTVPAKN